MPPVAADFLRGGRASSDPPTGKPSFSFYSGFVRSIRRLTRLLLYTRLPRAVKRSERTSAKGSPSSGGAETLRPAFSAAPSSPSSVLISPYIIATERSVVNRFSPENGKKKSPSPQGDRGKGKFFRIRKRCGRKLCDGATGLYRPVRPPIFFPSAERTFFSRTYTFNAIPKTSPRMTAYSQTRQTMTAASLPYSLSYAGKYRR